jgi:hypothetical protein
MDGFAIAAVSAAGVILASFMQWRSNAVTNRRAAEQAKSDADEREREANREFEERRLIREEDQSNAERIEAQQRLSLWREKRVPIHEGGLRMLRAALVIVDAVMTRFYLLKTFGDEFEDVSLLAEGEAELSGHMRNADEAFTEQGLSVGLYAGKDAAAAYEAAATSLEEFKVQLIVATSYISHMKDVEGDPNDGGVQERYDKLNRIQKELKEAVAHYMETARADLET